MRFLQSIADWFCRSRRKLATAGVGVLACLLAAQVVFSANGMLAFQKKRGEHRELQQQIRALEQENERISRQIKALKTDPQAIEKEAREQLRYARPGEVVIVLEPEKPAARPEPQAAEKR